MEMEIFETNLGLFKIITQDKTGNLLIVQTYLIHDGKGSWENIGYMKRKAFMELIKPHNPRKFGFHEFITMHVRVPWIYYERKFSIYARGNGYD